VFKKVPDVFVIVFGLIVLAAILTWVLPGGRYERTEKVVNGVAREVVDPESYTTEASNPQSLGIFTAPVKGFLRLSDIIAFIFLVGGSFFVLNETGAITAADPHDGEGSEREGVSHHPGGDAGVQRVRRRLRDVRGGHPLRPHLRAHGHRTRL
jgi:hypothetical protein